MMRCCSFGRRRGRTPRRVGQFKGECCCCCPLVGRARRRRCCLAARLLGRRDAGFFPPAPPPAFLPGCCQLAQNRNSGSTSIAHRNLDSRLLLNTFSSGTSLRLHLQLDWGERGARCVGRLVCVQCGAGAGAAATQCPAPAAAQRRDQSPVRCQPSAACTAGPACQAGPAHQATVMRGSR